MCHVYNLLAAIYRHHKNGRWAGAEYVSTLTSMLIILMLLSSAVILFADACPGIVDFMVDNDKATQYVLVAVMQLPVYLLLCILFRPKKIKEYERNLSDEDYKKYKMLWYLLFAASFALFTAGIMIKK